MFCIKCGHNIDPSVKFCPNCGTVTNPASAPVKPQTAKDGQVSMKWYNFLINFMLWASAFVNIIRGISTFFKGRFYLESLVINFMLAIASFVVGGLSIYTRFRLAGFYKNGPKNIITIYAVSAVMYYLYAATSIAYGNDFVTAFFSTPVILFNLAMIAINNMYFQKRSHLFTK